ncbi:MAG: HDOD domain-containing protein [Spirochaetia bacterium]|nr:HDOD domain-containing protein [Spirochaetia bacterium]
MDLSKIDLPFQPHVLAKILQLNENSDMNFKDLDNLIRADQNMTTLILKVANSSFYSRGNEISNLQQAIGMIGFKTVLAFATAGAAKKIFESGNYSRFRRYVWEHCIVTATLARVISGKYDKDLQEEAFIGGLLHDIGKVILNIVDRQKFIEVIHLAEDNKIEFIEAENYLFETNHAKVGGICIENWHLPRLFKIVAEYHENPLEIPDELEVSDRDKKIIYIISYSNYLAKKYKYGNYLEGKEYDISYAHKMLNFSEAEIQNLEENYAEAIKEDQFYKFFITVV